MNWKAEIYAANSKHCNTSVKVAARERVKVGGIREYEYISGWIWCGGGIDAKILYSLNSTFTKF